MAIRIPEFLLNDAGKEHYAKEQAKIEAARIERNKNGLYSQSISSGWTYKEELLKEETESSIFKNILIITAAIAIVPVIVKLVAR